MSFLPALLEGGWLTGLALAVLAVETLALLVLKPGLRRGLLLWNAAAGAALVGALHAALGGWGAPAVLGLLSVALLAHLGDLAARLSAGPKQ